MNIRDFRKQYPQYDSVSDVDLAVKLHEKFYKDTVPLDMFGQKFGVEIPIERLPQDEQKKVKALRDRLIRLPNGRIVDTNPPTFQAYP